MSKIYKVVLEKKITAKSAKEAERLVKEALAAVSCEILEIKSVELWKEIKNAAS